MDKELKLIIEIVKDMEYSKWTIISDFIENSYRSVQNRCTPNNYFEELKKASEDSPKNL